MPPTAISDGKGCKNIFLENCNCVISCHSIAVTLHHKTKTIAIMGIIYSIQCKHCGTLTKHYNAADMATVRSCERRGRIHVETDYAIRCPACRHRLNDTEEEFLAQVKMEAMWQ